MTHTPPILDMELSSFTAKEEKNPIFLVNNIPADDVVMPKGSL